MLADARYDANKYFSQPWNGENEKKMIDVLRFKRLYHPNCVAYLAMDEINLYRLLVQLSD